MVSTSGSAARIAIPLRRSAQTRATGGLLPKLRHYPKFTLSPEIVFTIVELTHTGSSNFIVRPVDAAGSQGGAIVNEIGRYKGTVFMDEHAAAFQIDADGAWTATIRPAHSAPAWAPIIPLSGTGDSVYLIGLQGTELTTIRLTHNGDSNFIVSVWTTSDRDLLVNEIGDYSGEVVLPAGSVILEIRADGAWTITKT